MTTPRRRRSWADRTINQSIPAGGGFGLIDLLLNAPAVDTITVARILVDLNFQALFTNSDDHTQLVTVGVGVSSAEAFAVGGTALPDASMDTEYPPRGWLYAATLPSVQVFATGVWRGPAIFTVDLGGMRKIDKGTLFMSMENNDVNGVAAAMVVVGRTRALCLM